VTSPIDTRLQQGERLAIVETRVDNHDARFEGIDGKLSSINDKLAELLEVKQQGAGAIKMILTIGIGSIITAIAALWHWMRG
jgi:hypothetical protein